MPRAATTTVTDDAPSGGSQRARILAAAADLMALHGAEGMTMRQLASACGLNIATLYHYVGSKSDLLGAIVAERRYDAGLRRLDLPVDASQPPRARLEAFFVQLATQSLGELRLWRLVVGEGLRDDPVALAEARRLSSALDQAIDGWLADMFPELDAATTPRRADVASVVTGQLVAVFLEEMLLGARDGERGRATRLAQRAAATAAVVFPAEAGPT